MHICSPNDVNNLIFIFLTFIQESNGCHAVDEANLFFGGRWVGFRGSEEYVFLSIYTPEI